MSGQGKSVIYNNLSFPGVAENEPKGITLLYNIFRKQN